MDCRSTAKRRWIIENYNVIPVAHIQLLAGQTKHSDAGKIINNDYYIFEAINNLRAKNNVRNNICRFDLLINAINNMTNRDGVPLNIQSLF